jgi:hypothetical protein
MFVIKIIKINPVYGITTKKYHSEIIENLSENTKIIKNKDNKYKCKNCIKYFNTLQELDKHVKTKCVPCVLHNNVFTFKIDTFGKNKYSKDNGGDIYIIQTDFSLKHYYKIGITTNLYNRMKDYRCGAVLEPRIHCYFPIKNIKQADNLLKIKLQKYNIKREIYKCENLNEIKQIIKLLQKELNSKELEVIPEIKECNICECEYCKEVFTNNYELTLHLNTCENLPKVTISNNPKVTISSPCKPDGLTCKYCSKVFKFKQGRWRHEQNCDLINKDDYSKDEIINLLKQTIDEQKKMFEEQIIEMKNQLIETMNKKCKVHPKTLQKINKQLINDNNISINKGTVNNTYNIIGLGHENLDQVFTRKEKMAILKNRFYCLPELVEYTHFNDKYPQFKNILITNTQNTLAYKYDTKKNQFMAINKDELLEDIVDARIYDISSFYEEPVYGYQ